ncbi:MAG: hypothetical protein ACFFAS_18990 [Promethearchaeota archaeon]
MKQKDLLIGIVLVAASISAGFIGYFIVVSQNQEQPSNFMNELGLPSNWNGAPLDATILVDNGTDVSKIFFSEIKKGVELWMEQILSGIDIHEEENLVAVHSYKDAELGLIAGVNVLDVLELSETYFGWDLIFQSHNESQSPLSRTTGIIIDDVYGAPSRPTFIALAIDRQWIGQTEYASQWGNFTIAGRNISPRLYDLKQINVTSEWKVNVKLNGTSVYNITTSNMWDNAITDTYSYYRSDGWNFNSTYIGCTVFDIINQTEAGNYNHWQVKFRVADSTIPWEEYTPYNRSEVENGMYNDGNLTIPRDSDDIINKTTNPPGVGLPITDKLMVLAFRIQKHREINGETGIWDPEWKAMHYCGYAHGPFVVYVPGRTKANYPKYITEILIEASNI